MCESSPLMPPSPSPPRPPGQPPEFKHFCRVCNKGFTCGSALGGHMRAHGASDVDGFGSAGADDESLGDELASAAARCRGGGADDQWDAAVGTSSATHAYALRANPNRLIRSCQVCKNCGKEFTSWELFLRHGKCSSEDEGDEAAGERSAASLPRRSSSPPSDAADGEEDPAAVAAAWSKGKRSRRVKLMFGGGHSSPVAPPRRETSREEEDLANCLVMLSSSKTEHPATVVVAETDHQERRRPSPGRKDGDGAPPLNLQPISFFVPASEPVVALPSAVVATPQYISPTSSRNVFECKACKKVFTSHQALGGHRASHKKVKGCFAARFENNASEPPRHSAAGDPSNVTGKGAAAVDEVNNAGVSTDANKASVYTAAATDTTNTAAGTSEAAAASLSMALAPVGHNNPPPVTALTVAAPPCKKNTKMHECSVCHRLFTSGQALGGHKRCHWLTSSTADPYNPAVAAMIPPLTEDLAGVVRHHQLTLRPMMDASEPALDLTIAANPAPLGAAMARHEAGGSSFRLDALAAPVHLQPLAATVPSSASHRKKTTATNSHHGTDTVAEEDEADSTTATAKRAKLSDLKDVVSMDGEPTGPSWLQVGIGSSSAGGGDDKSRESAIN